VAAVIKASGGEEHGVEGQIRERGQQLLRHVAGGEAA
jgi:hypothetical protein